MNPKTVTMKRMSTDEPNVALRQVWYDLYVNGEYHDSRNDVCDALDRKQELERTTVDDPLAR